ncbi:uncharacterized protein B0H18DRAFT_1028024 [Fomitopsis serialis]|uniref:uncharacterized protein n=1 Tax=Fomitopsis serialis TaxID=139415 RepID=UPI002007E635|nr:uncharacterized protein B0H18DRAFT_1058550 [Neoantrodia serialis]XP_047889560.1 uncharacterized protein B0H18DRAFT_1028024 [Neoantrodia serialis]KAH9911833.1 hypothetical protein B0H18DRAFT_1058550 [Neoantrodia serialis]KAH9919418.1 hypothetical protein B0H18DRAFT_1028024 [Neoantrodia serialis]
MGECAGRKAGVRASKRVHKHTVNYSYGCVPPSEANENPERIASSNAPFRLRCYTPNSLDEL